MSLNIINMITIITIIIILILIINYFYKYKNNKKISHFQQVQSDELRGVYKISSNLEIEDIIGNEDCITSLRKAGNIHKMVRRDMRPLLKPGLDLIDLSTFINNRIRHYTNDIGYNGGIAFPPIPSLSCDSINMIAHYSPYKDKYIFNYNDNLKIDFGVHVNGWIVDSSATVYFNPDYDILHNATKEALYSALKIVGLDTPINDVSSIISEIVESYEMEYKGKTYQLKIIDSCGGHSIKQYNIHGGIHIANKPVGNTQRFTQGIYAIEPFASIISRECYDGTDKNNYRIKPRYQNNDNTLYKYFNNLIFTDSHLDYYNINNINYYLDKKMLDIYPVVCGLKGDMSCQYEHTVYLDDKITEVITKFEDY